MDKLLLEGLHITYAPTWQLETSLTHAVTTCADEEMLSFATHSGCGTGAKQFESSTKTISRCLPLIMFNLFTTTSQSICPGHRMHQPTSNKKKLSDYDGTLGEDTIE